MKFDKYGLAIITKEKIIRANIQQISLFERAQLNGMWIGRVKAGEWNEV